MQIKTQHDESNSSSAILGVSEFVHCKAEHHVEKHHQVFNRYLVVTKNDEKILDRTLMQL